MSRRAWGTAIAAAVLGAAPAFAADPPSAAASAPAPVEAASAPAAAPATAPVPAAAKPDPDANERLQVTDPYLQMHTGPGRGFPVFNVVARGEWVEIELRHTDWYRVKSDGGKVGWVPRSQLESTLTAGGARKSFRDVLVDDFLNRKVQLGAAYGRFKSEPMLKLWTSYRLSETLSLEGTVGQVQGVFSGTDFWHLDLTAEPWSDQRISPFLAVGVGKFRNFPNQSLVGANTTNAKMANAGIGVRYYLSDRFVVRADYSLYTVFVNDAKTSEYRAWTAGLAFFF